VLELEVNGELWRRGKLKEEDQSFWNGSSRYNAYTGWG